MARDTGLNMDTDSEVETSIDGKSDKLPYHQMLQRTFIHSFILLLIL
jgi:hypothetical protein